MSNEKTIKGLVGQLESIAIKENANKITSISVKLGALSRCTPEFFEQKFVQDSEGTIAEGARLIINEMSDTKAPDAQEIIFESIDIEERP